MLYFLIIIYFSYNSKHQDNENPRCSLCDRKLTCAACNKPRNRSTKKHENAEEESFTLDIKQEIIQDDYGNDEDENDFDNNDNDEDENDDDGNDDNAVNDDNLSDYLSESIAGHLDKKEGRDSKEKGMNERRESKEKEHSLKSTKSKGKNSSSNQSLVESSSDIDKITAAMNASLKTSMGLNGSRHNGNSMEGYNFITTKHAKDERNDGYSCV